jgi:4-hydroxyphenylpyruvate dioxygenase-like putative hemolysin
MLGRDLAYVALVARDVAGPAAVFERLGLARSEIEDGSGGRVTAFAAGDSTLVLFPEGHPFVGEDSRPGVHHIALGVPDLTEGLARAGELAGAGPGRPARGLGGRARVALDAARLAGIRTWLTEPLERPPHRPPHRSAAVERVDHLGIASADNLGAIAAWCDRLGCPLESQQTDMEVTIAVESFTSDRHGVVYHTRPPVPVGGLRVAFVTVGDTELEFLQPFDPRHPAVVDRGEAGTTRQDQGAIGRFLARRGAGLHHLALKTPDIDAALTDLDRAGLPLIDRQGRPGSRAGRIGFIDPAGMGGILVHLDERP